MNRSQSIASTRPIAVSPPNVRIGMNADSSRTLKPVAMTTQVAIIVGPVCRSADASAPSPRCFRSRNSWT
jgi:hypothetical protein